jgi:transposase
MCSHLDAKEETMTELKKKFLEQEGLINPKPERVSHPLFETLNFFDPLDLPQVRYEMIRTARVENISVSKACELFGFSREYFYKLERSFMARGYVALLGSTLGRRPIIALNQEIVNFIVHRKMEQPTVSGENLRQELQKLYNVDCSRRTVERIVEKLGLTKKGPASS